MTNEEKIETLKLLASKVGGDVYKGYSGRYMYGAKCYGITCDDYLLCIEWAVEFGLENAKWDNLGKNYIVYWPDIIYDPAVDYAAESQEEDSRPLRLGKNELDQISPEKRAELDQALLKATAGVSALIAQWDILGVEERSRVHQMTLALSRLEHLKTGNE